MPRLRTLKLFLLLGWLGLLVPVTSAAEPQADANKLDVLICAPHSDDEAIGCTGVILRAIAAGKSVGVVVITAGDGFPKAAAAAAKKPVEQLTADDYINLAALRQRHSLHAMADLGVTKENLHFLGYPDGGLASMYSSAAGDSAYKQPFTEKSETYGPVAVDYHSRVHGRPAPYLKAALLNDLADIIRKRQPSEIYVTSELDTHPDHRISFLFVRDAAKTAGFNGDLWTFVVHGKPPEQPADRQLTLTAAEFDRKRALLESYEVGVSPVHDKLAETYTQPEERFWRVRLTGN